MNTIILSKNISEVFSRVIFVVFYVLLLAEFFVILHNSSAQLLTIFVVIAFFLITLFSSFWGIWIFVATIPLINGFFMIKGFSEISLVFVGVYLAWFPKHFFNKKSLQPSTSEVYFANLLTAIILLNLCLVLGRIVDSPIPSRAWFDWFSYFPFVSQKDNLWQINAALIFLKGIFLFRMIDIELRDRNSWIIFTKTIYVQAVFIAGFSLVQFVTLKTRGVSYLRLYLPFNDIHSYGSYVSLLLIIFFSYFLFNIISRIRYDNYHQEEKKEKVYLLFLWFDLTFLKRFFYRLSLKNIFNALLAVIFFFFCIYSFSRMTWLVTGLILLLIVIAAIKNKLLKIFLCIAVFLLFISSSIFSPKLIESKNPSLYRLGSFLNVKNYNKDENLLIRSELWGRSLAMVKDYPLTGVGVGNFYRNNVYYKNRSMGRWDFENAHNYYLQLSAELGFPAIVLFLSILFFLYFRQILSSGKKADFFLQEISVTPFLYGLGAYLITMLTGHPLLLSSQQFLFWAIVAIILNGQILVSHKNEVILTENKIFRRIGVLLLFLYVFGFVNNLSKQEPWTMPVGYGLYSAENWDGSNMRWMAGKAEYYLPETTRELNLKVVAQPFNSQKPDGLTLTISINDSVVDKVHFLDGGTKELSYDVSPVNKQDIKVNLEVDKVFCPKKIGLNNDFRKLGVAFGLDG